MILVVFVADVINSFRKALDVRHLLEKLNSLTETAVTTINSVKTSIANTYTSIQDNVDKKNEKINNVQNEFIGQIEELFAQFELRFSRDYKKDKDKKKYANRFFHNSFNIEKYTLRQINKLKSLVESFKNNKNNSDGDKT